jgi:hypothetical protein
MARDGGTFMSERRLDGDSKSERHEINQREIARLQDRLAIAVRRELGRD